MATEALHNDVVIPRMQDFEKSINAGEILPSNTTRQMKRQCCFGRRATTARLAGSLQTGISFLYKYNHKDFSHFVKLTLNKQVGACLHTAALGVLYADVEHATHLRDRGAHAWLADKCHLFLTHSLDSNLQVIASATALLEPIKLSINN
jgi:hypothetical protein